MLEGASQRVEIFGKTYGAPFGISPIGSPTMWCYRVDLVLALAAQRMGIPAVMSEATFIPMEVVAAGAPDT